MKSMIACVLASQLLVACSGGGSPGGFTGSAADGATASGVETDDCESPDAATEQESLTTFEACDGRWTCYNSVVPEAWLRRVGDACVWGNTDRKLFADGRVTTADWFGNGTWTGDAYYVTFEGENREGRPYELKCERLPVPTE